MIPATNQDLHDLQAGVKAIDLSKDTHSNPPTPPLSQHGAGRPARFTKSTTPANASAAFQGSEHYMIVQQLYDAYDQKLYMEGFVHRKNESPTATKNGERSSWTEWYVELRGPHFMLREATTNDDTKTTYINIAEATTCISAPPEGAPYRHAFMIKSSRSTEPSWFAVGEEFLSLQWVRAMRLSCFESSRIEEIFTRKLLSESMKATKKLTPKLEGYVQVRFGDEKSWQKYWVVMSDRRDEKRLFGKRSVPSRGQLMFFETKKSKTPLQTIVNVVQAYAVYPKSAQFIDKTAIMKVEGSCLDDSTMEPNICIMTEGKSELVQWLLGTFETFKMYGQPEKLLDDPTNMKALNFAEPTTNVNPSLFLSLTEVGDVNVHNEPLIDNKTTFAGILASKLGRPVPLKAPEPVSGMGQRTISMPTIAQNKAANLQASHGHRRGESIGQPLAQSRRGKVTYVSDESDDDEDDDEEDEDEKEEDDEEEDVAVVRLKEAPSKNSKQRHESAQSDDLRHDPPAESDIQTRKQRPRPKMVRPQASVSGSGSEDEDDAEEEDDEEEGDDDDSCDEHCHRQSSPSANHSTDYHQPVYGQEWTPYHPPYEEGEDGPVIPQLGDNFATHNSLLDTFRPDHPSARDQIERARATGQPLIQIPNKPAEPRAGLVGMISQIEHGKREREANKGRQAELDKERLLEQQRERYMMDHRSQLGPQAMGQIGGMPMMGGVPDPRMAMMPMSTIPMMPPYTSMMPNTTPDPMSMHSANMMDPHMMMMQQQMMQQYWIQQQMMQQQFMQQQQMMHSYMYNPPPQPQHDDDNDDDDDDDVPLGGTEKSGSLGKNVHKGHY